MTPREAMAFVKTNGIVLESARGPAPSLASAIAGEPIRGSWWKHRRAAQIFRCTRAVRDSKDVLVCRLLGGKVTYVHRRLWPALVKLRDQFNPDRLGANQELHTSEGNHRVVVRPFPKWVSSGVKREAKRLTTELLGLKRQPGRQFQFVRD